MHTIDLVMCIVFFGFGVLGTVWLQRVSAPKKRPIIGTSNKSLLETIKHLNKEVL